VAPEYASRGQLSEKVDVFSFGVLVLEIVSGRKNIEPNLNEDQTYLLEWVSNFCNIILLTNRIIVANVQDSTIFKIVETYVKFVNNIKMNK